LIKQRFEKGKKRQYGDYQYQIKIRQEKDEFGNPIQQAKVTDFIKVESKKKEIKKQIKEKIEGFDFKKYYVQEDHEPKISKDERQGIETSFNTYYRFGLIIYRMISGRKYEILYQISDSDSRGAYISFQEIIAGFKEDILLKTNLTLEEWIYLCKTSKNLYMEGGIRFKRYKNLFFEKTRDFKKKVDYDKEIIFDYP